MPIPTRAMCRRPVRRPVRTAAPRQSARNCKSSNRTKGVLDPDDAVCAVGQAFHADDVETHHETTPCGPPRQEVSCGAHQLALLAVVDGGERAAVVDAHPLSDLDDR